MGALSIKSEKSNSEVKDSVRSLRKVALYTGASLLSMGIIAGVVMGLFFQPMQALPESEWLTYARGHQGMFIVALVGWVLILITDIVVSFGVRTYFKQENSRIAGTAMIFRLVYSAILGGAIFTLILAFRLSLGTNGGPMDFVERVNAFYETWAFGLIIFGVHLLFLGYLVMKGRGWILKTIGALILIAGVGYLINDTGRLVIDRYDEMYQPMVEAIFMLPMILGEVGWSIWLLVKGGKMTGS